MPLEATKGMTLEQLHKGGVGGRISGLATQTVHGVQHDSHQVTSGDLFVAVRGETHDGVSFVGDALARGAVAVIAEQHLLHEVPQITVPNARLALGRAAELVYGAPTSAMHTVGITGTNGKTTTAYLLKQAIEGVSAKPALVGTTGLIAAGTERASLHTTPEGDDISRFARQALDEGATHLVVEVSSHGLAMHRVDALDFEVPLWRQACGSPVRSRHPLLAPPGNKSRGSRDRVVRDARRCPRRGSHAGGAGGDP
jgi:UDP-N-acetylmuramoyl-L-alanyl-D-glutamate--2,6-diaminopimelate ligase